MQSQAENVPATEAKSVPRSVSRYMRQLSAIGNAKRWSGKTMEEKREATRKATEARMRLRKLQGVSRSPQAIKTPYKSF